MKSRITSFLGEKYSRSFFEDASHYQKILGSEGILVLPHFINKLGLKKIVEEADNLKNVSFHSVSKYNVYVLPTDPNQSMKSARNRIMKTTKKCISNDLIASDSLLMEVYNDPTIKTFFATLFGVAELFPYSDPLSSVNINYYDQGDALGWHFDNSDFTITLLAKNCNKGGIYQYHTDMRYKEDGTENFDLVESILDQKVEPETQKAFAGDLMVFRGNKSLHQVTEVLEGERILITFNYNTKEGVSLSEKSRKTFFGRIA